MLCHLAEKLPIGKIGIDRFRFITLLVTTYIVGLSLNSSESEILGKFSSNLIAQDKKAAEIRLKLIISHYADR